MAEGLDVKHETQKVHSLHIRLHQLQLSLVPFLFDGFIHLVLVWSFPFLSQVFMQAVVASPGTQQVTQATLELGAILLSQPLEC